MTSLPPLISAIDLAVLLGTPDLRVLDASWHLDGADAHAEFNAVRIQGAAFFDIDTIADQETDLPHMMPSPRRFADAVGALGVSETDRIVVYDTRGLRSAPRAWWMLRAMGARRVQVLDGGLPAWCDLKGIVEHGPANRRQARFQSELQPHWVADRAEVQAALSRGRAVIDARSPGRFHGLEPEPRSGLRPGHMPGAVNLPFGDLIQSDGRMKSRAEVAALFAALGVDPAARPIVTCGSGVTAAIPLLGLAVLGHQGALYDGSWAEWGSRDDTAVVAAPVTPPG